MSVSASPTKVLGRRHLFPSTRVSTQQRRKMLSPYFLFFDVDADRELKIPISAAAPYMLLHEGKPAQLRKCKVMVKVDERPQWFLVITRYDADGRRNTAIHETTGFRWLGPLAIMKLERKGSRRPAGIGSPRDFHAAVSALERYAMSRSWSIFSRNLCRYLEEMRRQLSRVGVAEWRRCITEPEDCTACSTPSRVVENVPGQPQKF